MHSCYMVHVLVASPVLKSIEFSSSQSVRFISLYLWNILCLNDFPTNFETKITLNWHFFGTKPFFFYFVPKPTLFVNFSVYFDFLKFEVEMSQNGSVGFSQKPRLFVVFKFKISLSKLSVFDKKPKIHLDFKMAIY